MKAAKHFEILLLKQYLFQIDTISKIVVKIGKMSRIKVVLNEILGNSACFIKIRPSIKNRLCETPFLRLLFQFEQR